MEADERARAEAYCEQQRNRVAFRAQLEAGLAGDPGVRTQVLEDWQPVSNWIADRHLPPQPLLEEVCDAEAERHHADLARRFFRADSRY